MRNLFQRDMNDDELQLYCNAIDYIKNKNDEIIQLIDKSIESRNIDSSLEFRFYLNESDLLIDEKINYLIKLRSKLIKMKDCDIVRIRVAKPWHPMCWSYHLSKLFPKIEFLKNYIMHGFCVPFYQSKPIMLAHYVFEKGYNEVKDILAHELTHSLMDTKDLNATNYKDAINDAWTICFLY